jgi:nucleoporin p58/p45
MAFSFNPSSTPAFGAASAPAFSFGGASSTPAFGAPVSTPAFGAAPAGGGFGATPTPSLFGGGAVSTPAFSFASSPSLFGGNTAPAFGASPSPGAFGAPSPFGAPASTPSLFGATQTTSLFGAPQQTQQQLQQQQQQQAAAQLVTKDNRPLTHSTKWDDLSPQAQQYLMELEKIISSCREECRQLDGEERLQEAAGSRSGLEETVRALSQSVTALGVRVRADTEETENVREMVVHLLHHTEAALHTYKRTHAWREAARSAPGQPLATHIVEQLGGPIALPSKFLSETVASLHERLRAHEHAASELEAALHRTGYGRGSSGSRYMVSESDSGAALSSLQSSVANLHDCLMRTAAKLQTLDDRLSRVKAQKVAELRHSAGGYAVDPFEEAERQDRQREDARGIRRPSSRSPSPSGYVGK